jgi:hypothetical protein
LELDTQEGQNQAFGWEGAKQKNILKYVVKV